MLFKIQNLGAVKEAEIDLSKDLILLCGHNNTGKTYVAYVLNHFFKMGFDFELFPDRHTHLIFDTKKNLKDLVKSFFHENITQFDIIGNFDVCFTDNQNYLSKKYSSVFRKDLNKLFALDSSTPNFVNFKLVFDFETLNTRKRIFENSWFVNELSFKIEKKNNSKTIKRTSGAIDERVNLDLLTDDDIFIHYNFMQLELYQFLFDIILPKKTFLFPAERSAINIFNTELSLIKNKVLQAVLKDNSLTELAQRRVNRYPQPIRDSLELSQDLETLSKTTSPFAHLADELEQAILKGKISVGQYGDLRYSPAENPDLKLEMHVSSSLVKSLASISFYLRHIAQKGDCIIIDEPELNLHPDNQILVARFLARLVNEGFKVIASTHSDYIIREINNLIMLGKDSEKTVELRKKYEYSEKEVLKHEQVQALLFKRKKGEEKVVAENLTVSETGLAIETIDEVIEDLENRTEDIYFNLFEQ